MNEKRIDYSIFNKYYDEINKKFWIDYKNKCLALLDDEAILEGFAYDFGCGTGAGIKFLQDIGFKNIRGIDLSKEMIKIARKKYKNISFFVGDMTYVMDWEPGNLAICNFDAINYLITKNQWIRFFETVSKTLNRGGIFLFDLLTEFDHKEIWPNSTRVIEKDKYVLINHGEYIDGIAYMFYTWFIKGKNNQYNRYTEIHKQRSFPIKQIKNWLKNSNLKVKKEIDADTGAGYNRKTQRLLLKCVKV